MHVLVALIRPTRPRLLSLAVLQYLQDLRLQKSKPEIMMGYHLVTGFPLVLWGVEKPFFRDEPIVEHRGKLCGYNLIRDSERSSYAA